MKDTSAHNETESEIDQLTGLKKVNKCSLYKLVHRVAFVYNIVVSEVITSCNIQKITILNRCKMYSVEVEGGVFTPLVFSTTGGMAREATTFYRRLAELKSTKNGKPYSSIMSWIRCNLCFSILRSSILCLRGSGSYFRHPVNDYNLTLAVAEGQFLY